MGRPLARALPFGTAARSLQSVRLHPVAITVALLALAPSSSAAPPAKAAARAPVTPSEAAVTKAASSIFRQHSEHAERLTAISALFIGARYQLSPLGEGDRAGPDRDPIVRYDAFDCVTYVEQVMALSWYPSHRASSQKLQHIRYAHGKIAYAQRNHIMMAQWIPQNIRAGFVRDISAQLAPKRVRQARLRIQQEAFESKEGRALLYAPKQRPTGAFSVPIVPLKVMPSLVEKVPHGSIITTIRNERARVPYRASHVGLVIVKDGKRWIRHAHAPSGRVIEQPLRAFVARAQNPRKWPITGFNLLAIAQRPGDHLPAEPSGARGKASVDKNSR